MLRSALQWRLLAVWSCVAGLVVVGGLVSPVLQAHAQEVWGWIVATVFPPLLLSSGAVAQNHNDVGAEEQVSARFAAASSIALVVYGLVVLFTLFGNAIFITGPGADWLSRWLAKSGLWIGPLQGIVDIFLASVYPSAQVRAPAGVVDSNPLPAD